MAVLFLIGQCNEDASIVDRLLDIVNEPAKPDYKMADENALLLYDCGFDNVSFHYQPQVCRSLELHFEEIWERHMIAAAQAKTAIDFITKCHVRETDFRSLINYSSSQRKKKHQKESDRSLSEFLERNKRSRPDEDISQVSTGSNKISRMHEVDGEYKVSLDSDKDISPVGYCLWENVRKAVADATINEYVPLLKV